MMSLRAPSPATGISTSRDITRRSRSTAGFSLVEIIVATGLMVIVATGSALLFMLSNRQSTSTRGRQEQQSAISDDIATIQRLNERYNCSSGSASCGISESDPGEDDYYPAGSSADDTFDLDLCGSSDLLSNLVSAIDETDPPASFTALGITRQSPALDTDSSSHRYTVTWLNSNDRPLRQITLVPTVANWCP